MHIGSQLKPEWKSMREFPSACSKLSSHFPTVEAFETIGSPTWSDLNPGSSGINFQNLPLLPCIASYCALYKLGTPCSVRFFHLSTCHV